MAPTSNARGSSALAGMGVVAVLWFLIALGVAVVLFAVRDLLRRPDPTAKPRVQYGQRTPDDSGLSGTRAWDGLNGGGNSTSNGGGSAL